VFGSARHVSLFEGRALMDSKRLGFGLLLALALLPGCAVQHYQPAPINPVASAATLESRTLADRGLKAYIEMSLGHAVSPWPLRSWSVGTLTLAALYFSPQMEIVRDQFAGTESGVVAASEHPNPSLSLTPGIPSPYLFDMLLVFPIEIHGKRALRIEQARDLSSAAKIGIAEAAWQVTSEVRKALVAYEIAQAKLALSQSSEGLAAQRVVLLRRMLTAGEGARPDLQADEVALSNNRFALRENEAEVATTRAALAGAIGVPVSVLGGVQIDWPNFDRLPAPSSLSPERIQRDAVLNRLDVRRALDDYAAADAALRLELARQYPDFNIGPGYAFEETNNLFTVPFSIVLPIRNRNQGPIAQAEAMRKQAAANFLAVQAHALAQSEQALGAYRSAFAELDEADRPIQSQQAQVRMTERSAAAGETDRLQLNDLLLEGAIYAGQRLDALARAQAALGALEDAVEQPLDGHSVVRVQQQRAPGNALAKE
jgi:outer membrane protein, heavy metal efflux system